MPNYIASNLALAQARFVDKFQSNELRFRTPVVLNSLTANSNIMVPSYEILRTSESRPLEVYAKSRTSRVLGGARSDNHTGVRGDSNATTPVWTTYSDTFKTLLKGGDSNVYNSAEQLQGEIENVVANFADGLEQVAADFIFNNRSAFNAAVAEGTFNGGTNVFEVTEATNGNRAVQIIKAMMHENKYSGNVVVYCDTIAFDKFGFQSAQGTGNAENLTFQFANVSFIHSVEMNALAAGLGYTNGFYIAVEEGSVAALPWIPRQNREGYDSRVQTYTTLMNPADGLTYAMHYYEERVDGTPDNSETQDEATEYELSIDLAFETTPLTTNPGETSLLASALV